MSFRLRRLGSAPSIAGIEAAGLEDVNIPNCDVAGKPIDSGPRARCFAQYMFIHALEGTGGFVYSEMGQYEAKPGAPAAELAPGGGTNNPEFAQIDPVTKQPASNGARNVWMTETALATGLNVTFMASLLVLFTLLVGVALLLAGVGFIVIGLGLLPGPAGLRRAQRKAPRDTLTHRPGLLLPGRAAIPLIDTPNVRRRDG